MRLFVESDVQQVSQRKETQRAYEEEHADVIEARKAAERDKRAKEKQRKAQELVETIRTHQEQEGDASGSAMRYGNQLPFPPEICADICERIAASVEPSSWRTKGVVLRDLANVAMSCKDLNAGSVAGFDAYLHEFARDALPDLDGLDWDRFVRDPASFTVADLKIMARHMGVAVSGRKVEVIERIYVEAFGCATSSEIASLVRQSRGSRVPALKMHYIGVKRAKDRLWTWPIVNVSMWDARRLPVCVDLAAAEGRRLDNKRDFMIMLANSGISTADICREMDAMLKLARAKEKERKASLNCGCGQPYAAKCRLRRCATCCDDVDCVRHRGNRARRF
jgi:hypothetical protein